MDWGKAIKDDNFKAIPHAATGDQSTALAVTLLAAAQGTSTDSDPIRMRQNAARHIDRHSHLCRGRGSGQQSHRPRFPDRRRQSQQVSGGSASLRMAPGLSETKFAGPVWAEAGGEADDREPELVIAKSASKASKKEGSPCIND